MDEAKRAKLIKVNSGIIALIIIAAVAIVVASKSCTVIGPTERGVRVTLGKVSEEIMQPGFRWKTPFVQDIKKLSIVPKEINVTISVGNNAAVSKDLQEIGVTSIINYKYVDEDEKLITVVKNYNEGKIYDLINNAFINSIKVQIGQYTIEDLVQKSGEINAKVREDMSRDLAKYPIEIVQLTIDNWNWPDSFNKQIARTMELKQEAEQAKQRLAIAEQDAQKQVKEAEAAKEAAIRQAEAEKEAAQLKADAKKIAADAQAYENARIAQNINTMREQWQHEERMARLEKWNGKEPGADATVITPNYSGYNINNSNR